MKKKIPQLVGLILHFFFLFASSAIVGVIGKLLGNLINDLRKGEAKEKKKEQV